MIGSSLRSSVLLVLALAVSGAAAGCAGSSDVSAPSATRSGPTAPPASASPAVPAPSTTATGPASPAPATTTAAATAKGPAPTSPAAVPASTGDCPSLALVRAALGLQVGAPTANGSAQDVVVCSYPKDSNPSAVLVRIQENQTAAGFASARAGFAKSGQKTVDVPDMFDGAYRSQVGTATYGVTRTLVVLRGSTEVLVTARTTFDGLTRLTHTMLD